MERATHITTYKTGTVKGGEYTKRVNVVCTVHHTAMCKLTKEMQHFLRMILIFHYLALHVSDYHQSSSGAASHKLYNALQASLAVAWMYIHATARLA